MPVLRTFVLALALLATGTGLAATMAEFDFTGNVSEQHFKDVIHQLRCLVCQNETLMDSQADLAHDLRREVYQMMDQGKSDDEILEFLVARYGDFVLYDPPVKPSTYLLWFGPFIILLIAVFVLASNLFRRSRTAETALTPEQRARLAQVLDQDNQGKDVTK